MGDGGPERHVALPSGTVTFLFCDIEGSTRLLQDLGERFGDARDTYRRIVRQAIASHGGFELGTEGDSFFVAFDDAPSAVRTALESQVGLRHHPWPDGVGVRARMGAHAGDVILRNNSEYIGLPVHQAARVASAANGGQVLVTDAVRALAADSLPPDVELADLGQHRLKDLDRPLRLYEVRHPELVSGAQPRTLDALPHNLPVQPTSFTGRERELQEINKLIEDRGVRLVTLTGPGGIGKTRLSLHAAADVAELFEEGVWFVPLAPLATADRVPSTVAQVIGASEADEGSAVAAVLRELATKHVLIVLDNFEHVRDAAPFVAQIIAAAPNVTVLASSREPLHISAEHVFPVPPMEVAVDDASLEALSRSDAVSLFVTRARARDPEFALDAHTAPLIAGICSRLDGLPLAIELAAARASSLGIDALAERLRSDFSVLGGGPDDAPERHRTLEAAIAWSYDALDARRQQIVRALSVFAASFDVDAAAVVADATLDDLTSLADRSLLRRDAESAEPRFELLETIRAFAASKLDASDERDAVVDRHTSYFRSCSGRAARELHGPGASRWLDTMDSYHDDLRALLERLWASGRPSEAAGVAADLAGFWRTRGHLEEGRDRLARSIERCGDPTIERARAVIALSRLLRTGPNPPDIADSLSDLTLAGETAAAAGENALLARVLVQLAPVESARKSPFVIGIVGVARDRAPSEHVKDALRFRRRKKRSYPSTRSVLEKALALAEASGDDPLAMEIRASPHFQRGLTRFMRATMGDPSVVGSTIDDARARGDRAAEADLLLRRQTGPLAEREATSTRALELGRELGDRRVIRVALSHLAEIARRRKEFAKSIGLLHEALAMAGDEPDRQSEASLLNSLASLAVEIGDGESAHAVVERARQVGARFETFTLRTYVPLVWTHRFRGSLTILAGLACTLSLLVGEPWHRWVIGAIGVALVQSLDTVATEPARWRRRSIREVPVGLYAGLAFAVGLVFRNGTVAAVLLFGLLGAFCPGGFLRGRVFSRSTKAVSAIMTVAGIVAWFAARPAAPAFALLLAAVAGGRSMSEVAEFDGWFLARITAPVARLAAVYIGADVFATWRTGGSFHYAVFARPGLAVLVGALAACGIGLIATDPRIRTTGLCLVVAAVLLPFVASSAVAIVGFGACCVFVGLMRALAQREELPAVYPAHLRGDTPRGAGSLA